MIQNTLPGACISVSEMTSNSGGDMLLGLCDALFPLRQEILVYRVS